MWWLLPIAVVGAGAALAAYFSEEERDARQRWQTTHDDVQRSVEDHRRNIERHIADAQRSLDFRFLTDLHFSSHRVADVAYSAVQDARKSVSGMGRILGETKKKRDQLKAQRREARDAARRAEITEELELVSELRNAVFVDFNSVKVEQQTLLAELVRMNERTRSLKLAIRDRCGSRGQDWFNRLEARTAERKRTRDGRS